VRIEHLFYTVPLRLRSLFRRNQVEEELDEELQHHLQRKTEQYMAQGLTLDDASHAAMRDMDGLQQRKEECRDMRRLNFVDNFVQDFHYGFRVLLKNPSFTLIAVLTLGAGIGVNTAVFTAFNAVALRPLDVPQPDQVVQVDRSTLAGFFSYPDYVYLRDNNRSFSGLVAAGFFRFSMTGAPPLSGSSQSGITSAAGFSFPQMVYGRDAEPVAGVLVSGNYFRALGY
jgi:hypothetical protein